MWISDAQPSDHYDVKRGRPVKFDVVGPDWAVDVTYFLSVLVAQNLSCQFSDKQRHAACNLPIVGLTR